MISLDPSSRLSFSAYLRQYRTTAFPDIFYTFLHPFLSSLSELSSPPASSAPSAPPPPSFVPSRAGAAAQQQQQEKIQQTLLRTDADETIEQVWSEWEVVKRYLDETLPTTASVRQSEDGEKERESEGEKEPLTKEVLFPIRLNLPGQEGEVVSHVSVSKGAFSHLRRPHLLLQMR